MKIIVAKIWDKLPEGAVDINVSRKFGSPLGNQFSHLSVSAAKYKVGSRDEAVEKYGDWLAEQIDNDNQAVIHELQRIAQLAEEKPVVLQCYCHPLRCHADYVQMAVLERWWEHAGESWR